MDSYDSFRQVIILRRPRTFGPSSPGIEAAARYLHYPAQQLDSIVIPLLLDKCVSHLLSLAKKRSL